MTAAEPPDRSPDYRAHAGSVSWPTSPADLTSTSKCPACFAALDSPTCGRCGLDLSHPASVELLARSTAAALALDDRVEIIGRMRFDSSKRSATAAASTPPRASLPAPAPAPAPAPSPVQSTSLNDPPHTTLALPTPSAPTLSPVSREPSTPIVATTPAGTRTDEGAFDSALNRAEEPRSSGSSIQVVLLLVGISLLSAGAIFFLVYAFINYGLIARSVIIGAVTIAAVVVASVLRRRRLTSTAEGIASFGVVLIYLDAFAIRANDLLGAGTVDGALYWGTTLIASAIVFVAWSRVSGLRAPSIAAFASLAPGVGLVAASATSSLDLAPRIAIVAIAIALAGLAHLAAPTRGETAARSPESAASPVSRTNIVERGILLTAAVGAVALASVSALLIGSDAGDGIVSAALLVLTAGVAVAHIAAVTRVGGNDVGGNDVGAIRVAPLDSSSAEHTPPWVPAALAFAAFVGFDLAIVGAAAIANGDSARPGEFFLALAPLVAVTVALIGETLRRRESGAVAGPAIRVATWIAAGVGAILLLAPASVSVLTTGSLVAEVLVAPWSSNPAAAIGERSGPYAAAMLGLAATVAVAAVFWAVGRRLRRRVPVILWWVVAIAVLSVPLIDTLAVVLTGYALLAVGALVGALVVAVRSPAGSRLTRLPLIATVFASTSLLWVVGWASLDTWVPVAVVSIAIVLASRAIEPHSISRLISTATATVLTFVTTAAAVAHVVIDMTTTVDERIADIAQAIAIVAALLLAAASVIPRRLMVPLERGLVFWIAVPVAILALVGTRIDSPAPSALFVEPLMSSLSELAVLASVIGWLMSIHTGSAPGSRIAASVLLAPLAAVGLGALATLATVDDRPPGLTGMIAALVIAIASLIASRRPGASPAQKVGREVGVGIVVMTSMVVAISAAVLGDDATTWIVLALGGATLVAVSFAQRQQTASSTATGLAALFAFGAAVAGGARIAESIDATASAGRVAAVGTLLIAAALLVIGSVRPPSFHPHRRLPALDGRVLFWVSLAVAAATVLASRSARGSTITRDAIVPPGIELLVHVALLAAVVLWVAIPSTRPFAIERVVASIAIGPGVYLVLVSLTTALGIADLARTVAPATAALLTAVGALVVTIRRPSGVPRIARDAGVGLVAVPAVLLAIGAADSTTWLTLIITALTALVSAIAADGLFSGESRRRYLGWLALAFATAGLWWRLSENTTSPVEAYVLPVAGTVLIVAALLARAQARPARDGVGESESPRSPGAAPAVTLAALLIAILPISAVAVDGPLVRAIVVMILSSALLVVATVIVAPPRARGHLDALALSGAIGVIVTAVGRALTSASAADPGFAPEAWLGAALLVLVVAGFGLAQDRGDAAQRWRSIAARTLAAIILVAITTIESIVIARADDAGLRALLVVLLLSSVHVISVYADRIPFTRGIAWVAIAAAGVVAIVAIVSGAADPFEIATVPIAVALLASGAAHLASHDDARSWPWLGPPVALLLVPSLVATIDDRPLWRLVAIGVVGVVTLVVGLTRKLQAPFVLASIIVLVHTVATFLPQIRAVYTAVPWPLWLAAGGVLIIVLAARYEKRMANLRGVARNIGSLR